MCVITQYTSSGNKNTCFEEISCEIKIQHTMKLTPGWFELGRDDHYNNAFITTKVVIIYSTRVTV